MYYGYLINGRIYYHYHSVDSAAFMRDTECPEGVLVKFTHTETGLLMHTECDRPKSDYVMFIQSYDPSANISGSIA